MNTRVVCDRCHIGIEGSEDIEQTSGYYKRKGWKQFMSDNEGIVCDDCMWHDDKYIKEYGNQFEQKRFPIIGCSKKTIPWSIAEKAYKEYVRKYGTDQSLERLAERGGFGEDELNGLLFPIWHGIFPIWKDEVK